MRYMGGKAKVGKQLADIMLPFAQGRAFYLEPFVGACGVMQHMAPRLPEGCRALGADANAEMIAVWVAAQQGVVFPSDVSEEDYYRIKADVSAEPWLRGFVSVACSFGGKLWGGYARRAVGGSFAASGVRSIQRKAPNLQNVKFRQGNYQEWRNAKNGLIYMDPPYAGTTGWRDWNPEAFWDYARHLSAHNTVFVSEYAAPSDFVAVWEKTFGTTLGGGINGAGYTATEKLFKLQSSKE